jgi:hypothetical protein
MEMCLLLKMVGRLHNSKLVRFTQTWRFTALLVLIRNTRVNNHPEGKKSRELRPDMLWGRMPTVSKHITMRARLGLLGYLASSLALA